MSTHVFPSMNEHGVEAASVAAYQRDGAVVLRGVFSEWVGTIEAGIERNLREPSATVWEGVEQGGAGRFFDDYCNWQRIPEFAQVIRSSPAASIAAQLMGSRTAQFFHDHVLVKEPGTRKATPWHHDIPYYCVDGLQTVSFWIPVDPVREATLRLIAGSHRWEKWVRPVRWLDDSNFYSDGADYVPVPDPDREALPVLEWDLEPGDAVAFDFRTVHGARGNAADGRRRVLSLRWVGDDVRFGTRPGPTSPPFAGHGMAAGDRLREDWFPVVWGRTE